MPASEGRTRTFLLDTNVFIAAIKNPRRETGTLQLLLDILNRDDIELVGNDIWAEEMLRYAEEFRSATATWLVSALLNRARLVRVGKRYRTICKPYVTTPDHADILHAATCLQERAVLISNDKHFDRIRDAGVLEVWSITKAIRSV